METHDVNWNFCDSHHTGTIAMQHPQKRVEISLCPTRDCAGCATTLPLFGEARGCGEVIAILSASRLLALRKLHCRYQECWRKGCEAGDGEGRDIPNSIAARIVRIVEPELRARPPHVATFVAVQIDNRRHDRNGSWLCKNSVAEALTLGDETAALRRL
jgi:hypothetical protein